MNRREFLQCATLLLTGASSSQLGFALTEEQQQFLANAPDYIDTGTAYLSDEQRAVITAMCEVVIPRTETPGAIDAGVPRYVELMAGNWLNEQERAIFDAGLNDMMTRIPREYGDSFAALPPETQLHIMEQLESDASASSWYEFGNVQRDFISDAPFICQIKELTIWGFFTSEVGSKQVLRYNPMPGRFDGDYPLAPEESSWAGVVL